MDDVVLNRMVAEDNKVPDSVPLPAETLETDGTWVDVLVDCPGAQGLFTYQIPEQCPVQPGDILSVPFGKQHIGAVAIRCYDEAPTNLDPVQIRPIEEVVSRGFFSPDYWPLLQKVADYYHTPLMQVIRVALPPGLLRRSQRRIRLSPEGKASLNSGSSPLPLSSAAQQLLELLVNSKTGDYTWQYLQQQVRKAAPALKQLLKLGLVESYLEAPTPLKPKLRQAVTLTLSQTEVMLTPRQQEVVDVLKRRGGDLWLTELLQVCKVSSAIVKSLEKKGLVVLQNREILRLEGEPPQGVDQPKLLTTAQQEALSAINQQSGYTQILLHGVTGSGKTEVYLQAIATILQQGKSALVLVPEIGLTPQLTDRFRSRFSQPSLAIPVLLYHSSLSEGERYDTWRQMLQPRPQIVIGTRSAIFSPLPNLGLIVLDEEHDGSFKQDQPMPCYHARTVAQWRAQLTNCPLVLGSATPSLESWVAANSLLNSLPNREQGKLRVYCALPDRIQAHPLPPITVVDMRQELRQGNRSIFSRALQTALQDLKAKQQQGILFIHRRGHSTFVSCRSCGYVLDCPHCDVSLAYHYTHTQATQLLRCHYCNYSQLHPPHCPQCGSTYLKQFGSGTQKVMQALAQQFPDLRCLRFDSDTTRAKGAHRTLLTQFAHQEADLLVGTQMLTKGLDLPQVTLVGIVAADGLLHLPDFRASERAFQTLTQVAGRSGRGDDPGQVILQTYNPDHPVVQAVQQYTYSAFVASEHQHRQDLNYPPCGRLILLRLSSPNASAVQTTARTLAETLQQQTPQLFELLGPAPAPIPRIANRYRWQILLKLPLQKALPLANLEALRPLCTEGVSLTIDIDPMNFS